MASRAGSRAAKDVYRGYMPIDLPQHRKPDRVKPWWKVEGRPRVTIYPKQEPAEYSVEPEYPPLNDATKEGIRNQIRYDWYEKLKSIPTAEQKLYEIDRHCQHRIAHINNWLPSCNSLPFIQFLTHTRVINSLPESYKTRKVDSSEQGNVNKFTELEQTLKDSILSQLALDKFESINIENNLYVSKSIRDGNRRAYISNNLIANIVNKAKNTLALDVNPQLNEYQVDLSPAIRSWWYHSGIPPPDKKPYYRSRKDADGNISQIIQMDGSSALNFRSDSLIEPVVPMDDPLVTDLTAIEKFHNPLRYHGAVYKFKWPVALPGFWFEDEPKYDCPHTCFLNTDCIGLRNKQYRNYSKPLEDTVDCLHGQAILTAFGWLNSLSMYHGFTPFQELDYPLTCQVITTDGQNWLFNVYQLNSHSFHRDFDGPKRNNICWSSGYLQLYESYDNGNFNGINDDVMQLVIRFLAQQTSPAYTSQLNLRPYIGEDTRAEEEKDLQRKELRKMFEGRTNKWLSNDWSVPMFEHVFFRAKATRHQIRHMKPKWHIPKPLTPRIFE